MVAQEVQINKTVLKRFATLQKNNRLAHAYLFVGPAQIGKTQTALGVGKFLNCENFVGAQSAVPLRHDADNLFCDICPSCLKINHGNHPDIHLISCEETDTIKIEQIRGVISQIQLKSFEARVKVFILKSVEKLTIEGANALLKTLEEPAKNSLLILTSCVPEEVADTIRSRCHAMNFSSGSTQALTDQLSRDYALNQPVANFLAYYSQGSLGRARHLAEEKFFERKNEALDALVCSPESEDYLKEILSDKEKTKEVLDILLMWLRDLLILKTNGSETHLVHADRLKDLKKYEARYSFEEITELTREIVKAATLLAENLNVKIALSLMKENLWRK